MTTLSLSKNVFEADWQSENLVCGLLFKINTDIWSAKTQPAKSSTFFCLVI